MEGGLLLLVALLTASLQTASGQTVLRPAQTVQTASAQTVQTASGQTASAQTASSVRAVDQQREGSDEAAPPSRAPELGGYWSNVCSTTDRPIGGEYIVIPGQNSFQSCYRQCVLLTPRCVAPPTRRRPAHLLTIGELRTRTAVWVASSDGGTTSTETVARVTQVQTDHQNQAGTGPYLGSARAIRR